MGYLAYILVLVLLFCCYLFCERSCLFFDGICSGLNVIVALFALILSLYTYKGQQKVAKMQMFETTFFNMLNILQTLINELGYKGEQPTSSPIEGNYNLKKVDIRGHEVFKFFWEEYWFKNKYTAYGDAARAKLNFVYKQGTYGMVQVLTFCGSRAYGDYRELLVLRPYFGLLFEILKFIDTRDFLHKDQKKEYANKLRSFLTSYELVWIFYDCLFGPSNASLKPLVEKYSLLKYLSRSSLTTTKDITSSEMFRQHKTINDYDFYVSKGKYCKDKFRISAFED